MVNLGQVKGRTWMRLRISDTSANHMSRRASQAWGRKLGPCIRFWYLAAHRVHFIFGFRNGSCRRGDPWFAGKRALVRECEKKTGAATIYCLVNVKSIDMAFKISVCLFSPFDSRSPTSISLTGPRGPSKSLTSLNLSMVLGRIIVVTGAEELSLVRAKWLTKIFVAGDVMSFLAQSAGKS